MSSFGETSVCQDPSERHGGVARNGGERCGNLQWKDLQPGRDQGSPYVCNWMDPIHFCLSRHFI